MNLNQVTVPSTDVARSIEFYSRLGLRLIVKSLPKYARFECPEGTSTFSVHLAEGTASPSQTVVYFECADLDQKVSALAKAGVTFTSPPTDEPWLWREARLQDPDGNNVCLFHAGNNRLNPPWRLIGLGAEMANSKRIAGLVGPTLVAVTITEWMNVDVFLRAIGPTYGPHVYLNGTLLFVAGLAIVRAHNLWSWTWPVLITLVGWFLLFVGLGRMAVPVAAQAAAETPTILYGSLAGLLAIGAVLTIKGYSRDEE